ncbi:hypothetical protein PSACC_01009 [Paramicrosporidium saccamoebae]|uniref:Homeobox domain-containing protein n=1 Tax=Paramicrosporidium saccamoebae TaxID=1246581 RepID=A0A2H9TN09_9FUNG|nr:hypothetical protein PSACC_01009 [Paramicrosporidium saccamoebae]
MFGPEEWSECGRRMERNFGVSRRSEGQNDAAVHSVMGKENPNVCNTVRRTGIEVPSDPSCASISTGTLSIVPSKRAKRASPMDAFCFSDTFSQLTDRNQFDLQHAFLEHGGKLPSRREIRSLSIKLRLSQSRIRKWFLERSKPNTTHEVPRVPENETQLVMRRIDHIEGQIMSFQRKIEWLEDELKKSRAYADSLVYFAPSWLISYLNIESAMTPQWALNF